MFELLWTQFQGNKEWQWIFSGVGVFVLGAIGTLIRFLFKREANGVSLTNKAGGSSQNIQAGRDVHLTVREETSDTQPPQQRFADELVTFCSVSKAATTKLFLARRGEAKSENQNAFSAAFLECELHDASGQRLQLRARNSFSKSDVQRELF